MIPAGRQCSFWSSDDVLGNRPVPPPVLPISPVNAVGPFALVKPIFRVADNPAGAARHHFRGSGKLLDSKALTLGFRVKQNLAGSFMLHGQVIRSAQFPSAVSLSRSFSSMAASQVWGHRPCLAHPLMGQHRRSAVLAI